MPKKKNKRKEPKKDYTRGLVSNPRSKRLAKRKAQKLARRKNR